MCVSGLGFASFSLVVQPGLAPSRAVGCAQAGVRLSPLRAGLFDVFKESDEDKARKEKEFQAIKDLAELRRNPAKMAAYEADRDARRIEQMKLTRAAAAELKGENVEVVGYAEKAVDAAAGLPAGWAAAVDGDGDTYYWNKATGVTQWEVPQ